MLQLAREQILKAAAEERIDLWAERVTGLAGLSANAKLRLAMHSWRMVDHPHRKRSELNRRLEAARALEIAVEAAELNSRLDAAAGNKAAADEAEELNRKLDAAAENKVEAEEAHELNRKLDQATWLRP